MGKAVLRRGHAFFLTIFEQCCASWRYQTPGAPRNFFSRTKLGKYDQSQVRTRRVGPLACVLQRLSLGFSYHCIHVEPYLNVKAADYSWTRQPGRLQCVWKGCRHS